MLKSGESIIVRAREHKAEIEVPSQQYTPSNLLPGQKHVFSFESDGAVLTTPRKRVVLTIGERLVVTAHDERTVLEVKNMAVSGLKLQAYELRPGESATVTSAGVDVEVCVWGCTCGHVACAERHRLHSWDPSYSLWAFLAAAVKGVPAQKSNPARATFPLRIGSFTQAMYYPLLSTEGYYHTDAHGKRHFVRLKLVNLLFTRCADSNCGKEFRGQECPVCGLRIVSQAAPKKLKPAFIRLGGFHTHQMRRFASCANCRNLVEITGQDVTSEAVCSQGHPFFGMKLVRQILSGNRNLIARKKTLRERKKTIRACPQCGEVVKAIPWSCPVCGSGEFGQRDVLGWD